MESADSLSNYQEVTERLRQVFQEFLQILPDAIGYMRGEFSDIQSETSDALQEYNLALRQDRDDDTQELENQMHNLYDALRSRDIRTGEERMRVAADYAYNMGQLTQESDNDDIDELNNQRIQTIIDNLNNNNGWVNYIREHLPDELDGMLRQVYDNVVNEYVQESHDYRYFLIRIRYGLMLFTLEMIENLVNTDASENAVDAILVMLGIFGINNSLTRSLSLLLIPLTLLSPGHRRMLYNVISGFYHLPDYIQNMYNELDFRRLHNNAALDRINNVVEGALTYGSLLLTNVTNYVNTEGDDYIPSGAELEEIANTLDIYSITEFPPRDMYVNYINEPANGYEIRPGGHGRYPVRQNRNNWADRSVFYETLQNLASSFFDFFDGNVDLYREQERNQQIEDERQRRSGIMDDYYDMPESQQYAEFTDDEDNTPRPRSPQRGIVNYPDSDEEQGLVDYSGSEHSWNSNDTLGKRRRRTSKKSKYGKSGKPGKNNKKVGRKGFRLVHRKPHKTFGKRHSFRRNIRPVGRRMVHRRRPVNRRLSRRRPVGRAMVHRRRMTHRKPLGRRMVHRKPIKKMVHKKRLSHKKKVSRKNLNKRKSSKKQNKNKKQKKQSKRKN